MYEYYSSCVEWSSDDVDSDGGLSDMIDNAIDITRETFLQHVNRKELIEIENSLGYSQHYKQGLTIAADWAVSYHRSKLHGERVYYFRQSAIEHVFTHTTA